MNATSEQLYHERQKRVLDAVELKVPDRVPVTASFSFFPTRYRGCTMQEMMYDPDLLWEVHLKTTQDFMPDIAQNPFPGTYLGPLLDALDYRQMQWPGGQLGPNVPYQFVEGEYMKADEYDHFLSEPMDFMVRKYWPRISGSLKGFEKLPSFGNYLQFLKLGIFGALSLPEIIQSMEAVIEAAKAAEKLGSYSRRFATTLREEGFPVIGGGATSAPFDILGDTLRGTKGVMLDMYRRPETLLKACEKLLPVAIESGVSSAKRSGDRFVFIALHKGLDGFMSPEQFLKFYWPTLRELMLALISEGLIPSPFWEGNCTSRLDYIKDIPAGKAMYKFEATDMIKAKDVLRDKVCIRGNVPVSILAAGTTEDVRSYCRKLIDYAGKDGGFILDAAAAVTDAKVENVKEMFEFSRSYGQY
ncbi:MAG TPA: uroporphyrinogen decarboxylase family protein [Syntrophorhabdaceae bacterium]|nr:uroporphyrinogen decarboxylase family protein [Syntrophorhabdaceae bacterium]